MVQHTVSVQPERAFHQIKDKNLIFIAANQTTGHFVEGNFLKVLISKSNWNTLGWLIYS